MAAAETEVAFRNRSVSGLPDAIHCIRLIQNCSVDLLCVLSCGCSPHFVSESITWASAFEGMRRDLPSLSEMYPLDSSWNKRLAIVYQDLQYLTLSINRNVRQRIRWSGAVFQRLCCSMQSRLLHLHTELSDPKAESLRLAMLAFLLITFKVPGLSVPVAFWKDEMRSTILMEMESASSHKSGAMRLWLLVISAKLCPDAEDDLVVDTWRRLVADAALTWAEILGHCKRIFWIDCIHDELGARAYRRFMDGGGNTALEGDRLEVDVRGGSARAPHLVYQKQVQVLRVYRGLGSLHTHIVRSVRAGIDIAVVVAY